MRVYACTHAGDVVILVPYVGQLMRVRAELKKVNMRVVLSNRDAADLQAAGSDGECSEGRGAPHKGAHSLPDHAGTHQEKPL